MSAGSALLAEFSLEAARVRKPAELEALLRARLRWIFDLRAASLVVRGGGGGGGGSESVRCTDVTGGGARDASAHAALMALTEALGRGALREGKRRQQRVEGDDSLWVIAAPFEPHEDSECDGALALCVAPGPDTSALHAALTLVSALCASQLAWMHAHDGLAETNAKLARAVNELSTARDEEARASRERQRHFAMAAHELRAPLHGLLGAAELLDHARDEKARGAHAATVLRAGRTLAGLVDDVLELSRTGQATMELAAAPFDLRALVDEVQELFAPEASRKNIALRSGFGADAHTWRLGDAARLRQVVVNLVANALKFTAKGEVAVLVDGVTLANEPAVRLRVCDTGIGIAEESCARVFEPFAQADASIKARFGGTGLGLAICKQLCTHMGGTLSVRSRVGEGSTFTVTLPLPEASAPAPAGRSTPAQGVPPPSEARSVLVLDDDAGARDITAMLLQSLGHRVRTAEDSRLALAVLRDEPHIDVVFIDLHLSGHSPGARDGYDFAKEVRAWCEGRGRGTPKLFALTGAAGELLRAGQGPFDRVLSKPASRAAIASALRGVGPVEQGANTAPAGASTRLSELRRLCGGEQRFHQLVELHVRRARELLDALYAAADAGDAARVSFLAHRLAGSVGMMDGRSLELRLRALENAAAGGALPEPTALREGLARELAGHVSELRAFEAEAPAVEGAR
jgi:signal transduction histidine kinase/ActR/RegA family two-component response regulator